jgi:hypothetical protein
MANRKLKLNHGSAGWWLRKLEWVPVPLRRFKNGETRHPLWKKPGEVDRPITLSEAIRVEWARINKRFEEKSKCQVPATPAQANGKG